MRALLLLLACVLSAAEGRPGTVTFSDGTIWEGAIAMASGAKFQLHDGHAVRILDPTQVAELVFAPRAESMERSFSMPEPGKPLRVETGEAYPLRQLAVRARLADGITIAGHLYATAISVTGANDERRKLPLPAKQRGQPGQRLDQLIYVQRIHFVDGGTTTQRLSVITPTPMDEIGATAIDGLVPLRITDGAIDDPLGSPVIWAMRVGPRAAVGWDGDDAVLHARIQQAATACDDFFDQLEVIAARSAGDDVLSLMRLIRTRQTTDGPNLPWHVEVWRWRLDGDRSLIAGRVCLLRGNDGKPPAVELRPAWTTLTALDGVYTLGGWP